MKSKIIITITMLLSFCLIGVGFYGMGVQSTVKDTNTETSDNGGEPIDKNGILPNWIPTITDNENNDPVDEAFNNMETFDLSTEVDKTSDKPKEIVNDKVVEGIVPIGEEKDDRGNLITQGTNTKIMCSDLSPNTVYIPNIGLYSPITNKGNLGTFDSEGYFQLPDTFDRATQWVDGANITDEEGLTMLAAHRTYSGRYGVFNNLVNIKQGSIACVSDGEGNVQKYVVESLSSYDKNELPQELFDDSLSGEKRLAMITCGGKLKKKEDGYYTFESNVITVFKAIK